MSLTSICLCTHIANQKRLEDLKKVLDNLASRVRAPAELVIVDDASPMQREVVRIIHDFGKYVAATHANFPITARYLDRNVGHATAQNQTWEMATGDVLIHIEDDILVEYDGWNQVFAKCLQDHPEVGQVLPSGSGRGEWIPRPGYNEFSWGLGGLFAIRKEVFQKIGDWDQFLCHQIEPDYNFRVRMAGWRVAQINDFAMSHLGEGDLHDTFERQAQITIGVYNFLKKWNRRFFGTYAYRDVWCMSPDDFPINVAFRRQLAAWYAAEALKIEKAIESHPVADDLKVRAQALKQDYERCFLNQLPMLFQYPGHWGPYELVKLIRPRGREREAELIEKTGNNYVWRDVPELHKQIRELSERMFKAGKVEKAMNDDEVTEFLRGKEIEVTWEPRYETLAEAPKS